MVQVVYPTSTTVGFIRLNRRMESKLGDAAVSRSRTAACTIRSRHVEKICSQLSQAITVWLSRAADRIRARRPGWLVRVTMTLTWVFSNALVVTMDADTRI